MRRFAPARDHHKQILLLLLGAGCGLVVGLLLGTGLEHALGPSKTGAFALLAGAGAGALAVASFWRLSRPRPRPLGTSRIHDDQTTRAIEHALAAPGCAVAHSVRTIARAGVIDHLVATPVRLWVIAAVDRRLSREELPSVLAAIADNTTAVWDWAPPGTPVRGCLVVAGERRQARTQYDYGKGPVVVHTPATLARELKAESEHSPELDERVADAVGKLGPGSG